MIHIFKIEIFNYRKFQRLIPHLPYLIKFGSKINNDKVGWFASIADIN